MGEAKLGARFTPRRSRDNWSKYNQVRALMLLHNGKMTRAGIDVLPVEWATKKVDANQARSRKVADAVDGIIMDGKRFLVERRRDDDDADPGFVGVPGGRVEKNETLKAALRREMKEELGIEVKKAKLVQRSLYTSTNGERQRIHYFHVESWTGKIVSKEAERVYWESDASNLSIISDRKAVRTMLGVQKPNRK
jgi:8-oxo-dGTP diphosphatase